MNRQHGTSGKQSSIEMQAAWSPGTRTPAWDALWRQIMADLAEDNDQSSIDSEATDANHIDAVATPSTKAV